MDEKNQFFKIMDFSSKIGKHYNTVDQWFKKLEDNRIHYIMRAAGEKVYDQLDLEIGLFIKGRREEKWSHHAIHDELSNHFDLRPFPTEEENTEITDWNAIREMLTEEIKQTTEQIAASKLRQIEQSYEEKLSTIQSQYESLVKQLPKPEDQKQKEMDQLLTKRKVESKLRQDALKLWEQKPNHERYKKMGLFSKAEDMTKRDQFIEDYIDQNYQNELQKDFGLDN